MERRLQTKVFKLGLVSLALLDRRSVVVQLSRSSMSSSAKSIHHARTLIRQRHIRVGKQIVNVPSFLVRLDTLMLTARILIIHCSAAT
eukprot:1204446-Amphidinium_carterae.3